ncbi:MAG: hypothetical protein Ct9H300mP4_14860 [Gammaproteobacteria bacterium]|nr:MAG: hypothetical protein Ct9H300mP4_14860 [Gammaproteobacteria bacterium]
MDCKGCRWFYHTLGRASLRFQKHEFKVKTLYGDIPGANLLDWPLGLKEMEPWY